jgi:ribonucleoside-diphosphate reductase alpha chain
MGHKNEAIQKLLEDRYYRRDENGKLLENDPYEMYDRVAATVAGAEEIENNIWESKFYALMAENKFLPNTPTLINAGKGKGTLSGCFVLPVPDSMDGIFEAVKQSAMIMKSGGGIGYNFGHLREEGAVVKSTGQKSGGPISFMKSFDAMCDTVKQGGSRRGAMMAVLPVWHPDIEKFIEMKADGKSFSNFNISVGITDEFMAAVEEDKDWFLYSPNFHDVDNIKKISAIELWEKIVEQAWKTGDPGLIFLDTINAVHPLDEEIESTNPCGEIPLRPYESCNLGSINLMSYLKDTGYGRIDGSKELYEFDWDALAEDIPTMVRFLDDIIEVNPFPLPEIELATKDARKIGLGIMGWADCLIKMKIPYDSQEAIDLAEKLMCFILENATSASEILAHEKGQYPLYIHNGYLPPRRNATLLCVAPTGTLSRIAGVSSGIEPVFAYEIHHNLDGHEYDETHWAWDEVMEDRQVRPNYMKTANEIPWEWHLKTQAAFQKYIDNSVSKTINLSSSASAYEVADIYMYAWKNGLKGITIYRDGSKDNQPLNNIATTNIPITGRFDSQHKNASNIPQEIPMLTTEEEKEIIKNSCDSYLPGAYDTMGNAGIAAAKFKEKIAANIINGNRRRGSVAVGPTHKVDTTKGKAYITVNYSEYHQEPVEIFIRLGHMATPQEQSYADYIGRLVSVCLKYNVPLDRIVKQGNKVYSDCVFWYDQRSFQSIPMLISYLIGFTFEDALKMAEIDIESMLDNCYDEDDTFFEAARLFETEPCRHCGKYSVVREGGCLVCTNCYDEKCGG